MSTVEPRATAATPSTPSHRLEPRHCTTASEHPRSLTLLLVSCLASRLPKHSHSQATGATTAMTSATINNSTTLHHPANLLCLQGGLLPPLLD